VAKILVSIDEGLLSQIDGEARRRGMSRSALVSEMAARELGLAAGPGASPTAQSAMRALTALFRNASYVDNRDSTSIIREMRDSR